MNDSQLRITAKQRLDHARLSPVREDGGDDIKKWLDVLIERNVDKTVLVDILDNLELLTYFFEDY